MLSLHDNEFDIFHKGRLPVLPYLLLSGCWLFTGELAGLRLLAGRAGIAEAASLGMRAGLGGDAIAATRIAQANMVSIIASEAAMGRLAGRSLQLQIGEGPLATQGSALITEAGRVELTLGRANRMLVTRPAPKPGFTGLVSDHYVGQRLISQARYSADGLRIDYFAREGVNGKLRPVMYGLREPAGRSVAFFGQNHAYLGRVIYVTRTSGAGVATGALAGTALAGTIAVVQMNDFATTPLSQSCSDEFVLLRRTYYNQGEVRQTPDQFWEQLYRECKTVDEVAGDYQRYRLDKLNTLSDSPAKAGSIRQFLAQFPGNVEAETMLGDLAERGIR